VEEQKAGNGVTSLQLLGTTKPIVIKAKKKKKYKYSRGLKDLQQSGRKMSRVSSRLVRAMSKGMDTYRKASDKSARKKRDGAMRDFGLNVAKGMSKSLRESSRTPFDIALALNGRTSRKMIRRQVRATARLGRLFRVR
jgi:hypothetical protein